MIADRHRDRNVDADHANLHLAGEPLGRISVAGEYRHAVALAMDGRIAECFRERVGAQDLQHWAEDLILVALHCRSRMINQGRPQEEAVLVAFQRAAAAVDDQLGAFVDGHLNIAFDFLPVRGRDHRTHLGVRVAGGADAQLGNLPHQPLAKRRGGLFADGHDHRQGHAALTRRAVGRAQDVRDDLVKVGVR